MPKLDKGLIQVYTGNGKGKTSAAFGLAFRAAGRGLKIYIIQFIKGGFDYGELHVVKKIPNITLKAFGRGKFIKEKPPQKEDVELAEHALQLAKNIVKGGQHDIVILDEINVALNLRLIDTEEVLDLIKSKPTHVELVLTGRNAPDQIIEAANLVSDIREIKHPFKEGYKSRKGIEY